MDTLNRQLKKGVLEIVILMLLREKEMYGYELMATLAQAGDGFFTMKEGTLYPILYRLEDGGYIRSQWAKEQPKRGVPRKYYALTGEGECHLEQAKAELGKFLQAIERIMEEH